LKTWTIKYLEKPESDQPLRESNVVEEWNPHYSEKLKTSPNQEIGTVTDLIEVQELITTGHILDPKLITRFLEILSQDLGLL